MNSLCHFFLFVILHLFTTYFTLQKVVEFALHSSFWALSHNSAARMPSFKCVSYEFFVSRVSSCCCINSQTLHLRKILFSIHTNFYTFPNQNKDIFHSWHNHTDSAHCQRKFSFLAIFQAVLSYGRKISPIESSDYLNFISIAMVLWW